MDKGETTLNELKGDNSAWIKRIKLWMDKG